MALINCPDCGKPASDQAFSCMTCGFPIRTHMAQLKREEAARQAEEEALQQRREQQQTFYIGALVVVAFALIVGVGSCISYANEHPMLQGLSGQGNLQNPGEYAFSAHGKLQIDYYCQSSNNQATTVQFSLINTHSTGAAATVWKKVVKCLSMSQDYTTQTDTIQVPVSSSYDVGIVASAGDTTWNIRITQA
jgi:hypothetical protein